MFTEAEVTLATRAITHAGAFHRTDIAAAGLTRKQTFCRVSSGAWVEILPGVYRHAGTPMTNELRRHAAVLWAGAGAVVSHRSAGATWKLDRVHDRHAEVSVLPTRNPRVHGVIVHRSSPPASTTIDGLPCTTLPRTIVDLAAVLDEETLEVAFECARHRHGMSPASVRRELGPRAQGRAGVQQLRELLTIADRQQPCESALEAIVAGKLRASTLPEPTRQFWITVFGTPYRVDFAWPALRIALECDSRAWHTFQRDRTRWRQLGASGWRVLPVTWQDVRRDWNAVVAELATAIVR
jgi:very-short-patch-repair endonuclease